MSGESGVGGGGAHKRSKIEKCFKASYIAVLIKLLFEFTCLFKLHNIVKNLNSLQYKLEEGVSVCVVCGCTAFLFQPALGRLAYDWRMGGRAYIKEVLPSLGS